MDLAAVGGEGVVTAVDDYLAVFIEGLVDALVAGKAVDGAQTEFGEVEHHRLGRGAQSSTVLEGYGGGELELGDVALGIGDGHAESDGLLVVGVHYQVDEVAVVLVVGELVAAEVTVGIESGELAVAESMTLTLYGGGDGHCSVVAGGVVLSEVASGFGGRGFGGSALHLSSR